MIHCSSVLSINELRVLLNSKPPLIENFIDIESQLQPNGIDLTVGEIATLDSAGCIAKDNKDRVISNNTKLKFDNQGRLHLTPGCYLVTCNEIINMPLNLTAIAQSRSSFLRCGVSIHNAIWDAGYSGRSQALMVVYNPHGFTIYKNARFIQLIFIKLGQSVEKGYNGIFQRENI